MLVFMLLLFFILTSAYVIFRYVSLLRAIDAIQKEIDHLNQDLTKNQIIHLPFPDRHLKKLLCSVNASFEGIRQERQRYEKREREFQNQIENISHDLRTPLTVILGYIRLFQNSSAVRLSEDAELRHTLAILEQKAQVMRHLVTQFYDYSRLAADDYELIPARVDVSRLLRESLMGNCHLLEQNEIAVTVHIPDHPILVSADPAALERIFLNLFQNAGRYADTFFQISVHEQAGQTAIEFENDTRRLTIEDLPYLFDRFYMQNPSRRQGSTGLGLTVARSLAEKMNGTLTASIPQDPKTNPDTADSDGQKSIRLCLTLTLKAE